jgi:hypothetical protein
MEYNTIFSDDSLGFFKARDIDLATAKAPFGFSPVSRGKASRSYVMGVDPAKTHDRFAIVIIEQGSPNKIVYCWTQEKQKYSDGALKIRELCRKFNIIGIAMDEGGGGLAVEELINKIDIMTHNEDKCFYRYDEDNVDGLKNLYMINFTSTWIDESNSLLQKNIEDCAIMFPSSVADEDFHTEIDDIIYEVQQLKRELICIEVSYTKLGKRHFDLGPPDPKGSTDITVRHKDRYSALLLANYLATRINKLSYDDKAEARKKWEASTEGACWL